MKNVCKERSDHVLLGDDAFEVVSQYKYLGHIIQQNLQDIGDAEYRLNGFYAKLHWVLRNFKNTSLDVLLFLFNSYCSPDYGLPLWNLHALASKQIFKTFEVAYNSAFKKMVGTPMTTSSHAVANACNVLLFNHYVVSVQLRYFKYKVVQSSNDMIKIFVFNLKEGYTFREIRRFF